MTQVVKLGIQFMRQTEVGKTIEVIPLGSETSFNIYHSLALYFYSERLYAGISALDIFSNPNDLDVLTYYDGGYTNNIVGQYNFILGYYYQLINKKTGLLSHQFC